MILVLDAHPNPASLCAGLASACVEAATAAGAPVRRINLRDLKFDPNLHHGYGGDQELEPDLLDAQAAIRDARHLVFVYPTWWGTFPALLKGFLDRALLPGFAFRMHPGGKTWDKLLAGRSARLVVTMDWPVWAYRWIQGAPGDRAMARATLDFCGVKPVLRTELSPASRSTEAERAAMFDRVRRDLTSDVAKLGLKIPRS
jgi:putative NADPH-quinone reductase